MPRHLLSTAAVALVALAAPVAATAQDQFPPEPLDDFYSDPIDASSIRLCWNSEQADQADSWTLYIQKGTTPPPTGSPPAAEIPGRAIGVCHQVDGLQAGEAYSFALVGHNEAGDGPRQTLTAATRLPGVFVRGPWGTHTLPDSFEGYEPAAIATVRRTGRVHVVYFAPTPGTEHPGLWHTSRSPRGHWSKPTLVTTHMADVDPSIAVNEHGDVAVAWNSPPHGAEFRVKRHGRWSPKRAVPGRRKPGDRVDGIALDRAGHVHMLVNRGRGWPEPGERVLTDAAGRWTETLLGHTVCSAPSTYECRGLIVADPVRDRITVVARRTRHGVGTVLIADAPARSTRFGRLHAVASSRLRSLRMVRGSLTRYHGRITLVLRGLPPYPPTVSEPVDDAPGAGLYLATGPSPARMTRARPIPGTTVRDVPAVALAAVGPRTTLLGWQRDWNLAWDYEANPQPSWNRDEQGVWLRKVVRDRHGRLHFRAPTHVDDSAYSQLLGLAADGRGRAVVAFGR